MMVRTQISLPDRDHAAAKQRAAEMGISLSELIRRALSAQLNAQPRQRGDLSHLFGILDSGHSDTSSRVDELVAEEAWDDHLRSTGQR